MFNCLLTQLSLSASHTAATQRMAPKRENSQRTAAVWRKLPELMSGVREERADRTRLADYSNYFIVLFSMDHFFHKGHTHAHTYTHNGF